VTPTEFFAKWRAERDRFGRYRQLVDPLPVLDELLADVQALLDADGDSLLNLTQAVPSQATRQTTWGAWSRTEPFRTPVGPTRP